jgi:hypothetical protein
LKRLAELIEKTTERKAREIRIRAERKTGELLKETKQNGTRQGQGQPKKETSKGTTFLSDLGITRDQSSKWQQLAEIPEDAPKGRPGPAEPECEFARSRLKGFGAISRPEVQPGQNDYTSGAAKPGAPSQPGQDSFWGFRAAATRSRLQSRKSAPQFTRALGAETPCLANFLANHGRGDLHGVHTRHVTFQV